jgi:hypothetical protein
MASVATVLGFVLFLAPVGAQTAFVNVPSSPVSVIVQNDTTSYFVTTLSDVPSGFDVTNATYPGWCILYNITMTRNETYQAQLYSSLNPPSGPYFNIQWNLVNYILNHKLANFTETQDCIWYFVNGTTSYTHTLDQNENATIEDAYANGTGFIPNPGESVAVLVIPQGALPGLFQDSIIEATMPTPLSVNATVTGDAVLIGTNTYHLDSGASATFTANVLGGNPPYSYTWYINGTTNSTQQAMTFTAQQAGTYIINVNVTDSSNTQQNATSTNYTIMVPEYQLLTIMLAPASLILTRVLTRKKKPKP